MAKSTKSDTPAASATSGDAPGGRFYVSYAWADEGNRQREALVDKLCEEAEARGHKILRDKDVMKRGDSITAFMDKIARGDGVYVFLSDKYLKSPWCMYELYHVWRESRRDEAEFKRRTRLFTLDDAKIWTPKDRLSHAHFWQAERDDLEAQRQKGSSTHLGVRDDLRLRHMVEFANNIGDILALIADTVQAKAFAEFAEHGFDVVDVAPLPALNPPALGALPVVAPATVVEPPVAEFRGREADVEAILAALFTQPAAILVQGPPGIGKSELTRAVGNAPEAVAHFGPHRWFVALQAAPTAADLAFAVAAAVGADPAQPFEATLDHLARRPGLVVIDNLETPWSPQAERRGTEALLRRLAAVPGAALLASFRGQASVGGPAWTVHPVAPLAPADAAALFAACAHKDFSGDPHFAPLLDALGGVPLALRLVGRRVYRRASLAPLWAEWTRRGAGAAVEPGREKDRLGSLAWSIEISLNGEAMTPAADRLFRLLGALPAGLGPLDRDDVFGEDVFPAEETLLGLGLALERGDRLDLLAPIREYARVDRAPGVEDADRWRRHYLKLAREIGGALGTKTGLGGMDRLTPEIANLTAALAACLPDKLDEALAAVQGFGRFAALGAHPAPIFAVLAEACRGAGHIAGEADCIQSLGDIALARSDHDAARKAYEAALPLYQRVGDVLGEANCIKSLGNIALERSDHDAARKAYEAALPLYQRVGDVLGEANCIQSLGDIALQRSDHDAARKAYEAALPLYQRVGQVLGEANCIRSLGDIALERSDHDAARKAYEAALPLHQRVGDVLGEANCIQRLGDIALARSDHDAARAAYDRALPMFVHVGDLLGEGNVHLRLGDLARAKGNRAAARAAYETALDCYRRFGDPYSIGLAERRIAAL